MILIGFLLKIGIFNFGTEPSTKGEPRVAQGTLRERREPQGSPGDPRGPNGNLGDPRGAPDPGGHTHPRGSR